MAQISEVFKRKEMKYRLNAGQYQAVVSAIAPRIALDAYGKTQVSSVYLDTPDWMLIERSLDKPLYKEKLRIRAYGHLWESEDVAGSSGVADAADVSAGASFRSEFESAREGALREHRSGLGLLQRPVFVEIKKKYKGIVYKRRLNCSFGAAQAYWQGDSYEEACARMPLAKVSAAQESVSPRSLQIAREIDAARSRYDGIRPAMAIACERSAYALRPEFEAQMAGAQDVELAGQGSVRITFDGNLRSCNLMAEDPSQALLDVFAEAELPYRPILNEGEVIMEIKSVGALPLWLVHALDEAAAYPCSFSKYGMAYRMEMAKG